MTDHPLHPMVTAAAARSAARLADVELGLTHPVDGSYWRSQAQIRVDALEADEPVYGLLPFEVDELVKLKALLA